MQCLYHLQYLVTSRYRKILRICSCFSFSKLICITFLCELMTHKDFPFTVVPTALGTAMDINLSNESLVFISVTFATMVSYFIWYCRSLQHVRNLRVKQGETCLMKFTLFRLQCKSAAPIFLLLFAFAFRCFIHISITNFLYLS